MSKAPSPPGLPAEHYEYLRSLHWTNEYSSKLQAALGDDKLVIAWSPKAQAWACARRVKCHVLYKGRAPSYLEMPFIFMYWIDSVGNALHPSDPRLIPTLKEIGRAHV